jgi:hypothetical protein
LTFELSAWSSRINEAVLVHGQSTTNFLKDTLTATNLLRVSAGQAEKQKGRRQAQTLDSRGAMQPPSFRRRLDSCLSESVHFETSPSFNSTAKFWNYH